MKSWRFDAAPAATSRSNSPATTRSISACVSDASIVCIVVTDVPLADAAAPVGVEDLDRILDREDVLRAGPVAVVDERGDGRRLAGPRSRR